MSWVTTCENDPGEGWQVCCVVRFWLAGCQNGSFERWRVWCVKGFWLTSELFGLSFDLSENLDQVPGRDQNLSEHQAATR